MSVRMFIAPLILFVIGNAAYAVDAGDAIAGKAYFTQTCRQCHSAESGDGGGEIGPQLDRCVRAARGSRGYEVCLQRGAHRFEARVEPGNTEPFFSQILRRRYPVRRWQCLFP